MPNPHDLILCDAQTATGGGTGVVGFGDQIRYAKGAGVNRQKTPHKFKVRAALTLSTTGTATLLIEHCDDASTWVTLGTMVLSVVATTQLATSGKLFSTTKRYVRANLSAIAGDATPTVDAYMTLGGFGA